MPAIERATATDRAFLAMDTGPVPEQFGVLLLLDAPVELDQVRAALAGGIKAVPRLRQHLRSAPLGCGGPFWHDDPRFDLESHVVAVGCHQSGDEQAVLDTALAVVGTPLRRDRPLWSIALIPGPTSALVVVLHHVLADGIGGLAILGALLDETGEVSPEPLASNVSRRDLARDAWSRRWHAAWSVRRTWRLLRESTKAAGGYHPPRADPTRLVRPTGPARRVTVARADHDRLRAAAHQHGASTNDAVLVAIASALHTVAAAEEEDLDPVLVAVPVSGRGTRAADVSHLGNMVSPLLLPVPASGPVADRLRQVTQARRAQQATATGPPAIALLGPAFRLLAKAGGYRWYLRHQHRLHTLVSSVPGPSTALTFAGTRVRDVVPIALAEAGNITISFDVLTYAGTVTISAIADPEQVDGLDDVVTQLSAELDRLARP